MVEPLNLAIAQRRHKRAAPPSTEAQQVGSLGPKSKSIGIFNYFSAEESHRRKMKHVSPETARSMAMLRDLQETIRAAQNGTAAPGAPQKILEEFQSFTYGRMDSAVIGQAAYERQRPGEHEFQYSQRYGRYPPSYPGGPGGSGAAGGPS